MKKLNIEQMETTRAGAPPSHRTCMIGGFFSVAAVAVGFASSLLAGLGATIASLSAANYKGCFE